MQRNHASLRAYSADTEVLTRRGWWQLGYLTPSDEVATRTPDGFLEWQKPAASRCLWYEGEMVEFRNRYVSLFVTPSQLLYTRHQLRHLSKRTGEADRLWRLAPARHYAYTADNHWEITATASWKGFGPQEFFLPNTEGSRRPDLRIPIREFCGFVGLYISEGYIADRIVKGSRWGSRHIKVEIAQSVANPRLPDVEAALKATGLTWHYRNNRFYTTFARLGRWLRAECGHLAPNKHIPAWIKDLPPGCLESLVNGLMLGDGSWGPLGQHYYPSASKRLVDDVLEVFLKLGMDAATHAVVHKEPARDRIQYTVNEVIHGDGVHKLPPASRSLYRGSVYQIRVPNGLVLVRRDGRPAWSGAS